MKKELLKGLSEEQIAKVKACKNTDELMALAKKEGIELTDEQLEAVSGGGCFSTRKCPKCGSTDIYRITRSHIVDGSDQFVYICKKCGQEWI